MKSETPQQIGEHVVYHIGAQISDSDEAKAMARAVARAIRAERYQTVAMTPAEASAALDAISQMTDGNARDFDEWRKCTHGSYSTWRALLRAEAKLRSLTL